MIWQVTIVWRLTIVWRMALILTSALLAACSSRPPAPLECHQALNVLEQQIHRDIGISLGNPIDNLPALRSDRFVESWLAEPLEQHKAQALIAYMAALAKRAWQLEWAQLSPEQQRAWESQLATQTPQGELPLTHCIEQQQSAYQQQWQHTISLLQSQELDDDYQDWARVLGLYSLLKGPFKHAVEKEQARLTADWQAHIPRQDDALYLPNDHAIAPPWPTADALGLPQFSAAQWQQLAMAYAPQWQIATNDPANRPGRVEYLQDEQLRVNIEKPSYYHFVSFGRHHRQTTSQLNYLLWFSERPKLSRFDWVAGQHDALLFRIHLGQHGELLAMDSVHLCGCWYQLMLPQGRGYTAQMQGEPVMMQRVSSDLPVRLQVSADEHHIVGVAAASESSPASNQIALTALPWDRLYQLSESPAPNSSDKSAYKSAFNREGIVPGSQRPERWFFWPMGVADAGSLRRLGDHAIAFVGKRYFDQARLLEALGVE